jgi:hypothetical protein
VKEGEEEMEGRERREMWRRMEGGDGAAWCWSFGAWCSKIEIRELWSMWNRGWLEIVCLLSSVHARPLPLRVLMLFIACLCLLFFFLLWILILAHSH